MEYLRLGFVVSGLIFFFLMLNGALSMRSVDVNTAVPWADITSIFVYAAFGIFFLIFGFLLTRVGE